MDGFGQSHTYQAAVDGKLSAAIAEAAKPAETFADLLAAIETWTDLAEGKRRQLTNAVNACAAMLGRNQSMEYASASAFSCSLPSLNAELFKRPAKAHGMCKRTMGNYVCTLREVLRRAGVLHDEEKASPPTQGPWAVLLSGLNSTFARMGLASFAAWCDAQSIMPEVVTTETLAAFERFMQTQRLHANIQHHTGNVAKSWRRLIKKGDIKACSAVSTPNRRTAQTLPLAAFPQSFQEDYARLEQRLRGGNSHGPFRGDGPARALSDATIHLRLYSLRRAASTLVSLGRDITTITSLADLVEEAAFESILLYFWRHAIDLKVGRGELAAGVAHPPEAGITVQTGAIGSALMMVARYHVKLDAAALERLASLARDVRPAAQTEINAKTRKILNALSVPATRLRLMRLPHTLMTRAEKHLAKRPLEAARLAMIATAIKIELMLPLRINNLTHLRLDSHLHNFDPRRGHVSLLTIPKQEVKNRVTIEWPIDPGTGAFIARYVSDFRPLMNPGDGTWLFPSGQGERLEARSIDTIRKGITDAVEEHVGVTMHVHAFRAFVGMLLLEDSPGALEDLRLLLGHKTLKMAECYYAYVKPAHAAQRMAAIMDRARSGASGVMNSKPASAGLRPKPASWRAKR